MNLTKLIKKILPLINYNARYELASFKYREGVGREWVIDSGSISQLKRQLAAHTNDLFMEIADELGFTEAEEKQQHLYITKTSSGICEQGPGESDKWANYAHVIYIPPITAQNIPELDNVVKSAMDNFLNKHLHEVSFDRGCPMRCHNISQIEIENIRNYPIDKGVSKSPKSRIISTKIDTQIRAMINEKNKQTESAKLNEGLLSKASNSIFRTKSEPEK